MMAEIWGVAPFGVNNLIFRPNRAPVVHELRLGDQRGRELEAVGYGDKR